MIIIAISLAMLSAAAARNILVPLLITSGFLAAAIPVQYGFTKWSVLLSSIAVFVFLVAVYLSSRKQIFRAGKGLELRHWRIIARPFAMLFIPIRVLAGQRFLVFLLVVLSVIFITADLYRIISRRSMSRIFRSDELHQFSTMSSFLVALFIVFLLFPPEVSFLCLSFMVFGDMAAKSSGIHFGRTKIIHGKTIEGSMGFLSGSLFTGFIIGSVFDIDFSYLVIGACCATITELLSHRVNDNFTVGIITGGCLRALQYFQII